MRISYIVLLCTLLGWSQFSSAADMSPVKTPLQKIADKQTQLTLKGTGSSVKLSLADIESLPMYQTTLNTQWGMNGTFHGVLLNDLLAAHKLKVSKKLVLHALDNYMSQIPLGEVNGSQAMLATRFNGQPIPLNNKGPFILIWPAKDKAVMEGKAPISSWVWSVDEIAVQ